MYPINTTRNVINYPRSKRLCNTLVIWIDMDRVDKKKKFCMHLGSNEQAPVNVKTSI